MWDVLETTNHSSQFEKRLETPEIISGFHWVPSGNVAYLWKNCPFIDVLPI
jgi:hypothetical protein